MYGMNTEVTEIQQHGRNKRTLLVGILFVNMRT